MKLRKILAASAVVAVMTTALAVSAMADVTSFASTTLDYVDTNSDNVKDSVTITYADTNPEKPSAGPYTILIVKRTGTEGETELATPTGDTTTTVDGVTTTVPGNIKQIDEATEAFTSVTVGELEAGTYEVRIGGDGSVRWGTFEVEAAGSETGSEYYDDGTKKWGDVTGDGPVAIDDSSALLLYLATRTTDSKDALQAMDVTDDGSIAIDDSSALLLYLATRTGDVGTKTISEKTNFVSVDTLN